MIGYDYFYRDRMRVGEVWPERYDVFLSAWDASDRVRSVEPCVEANRKIWLIHPEYGLAERQLPPDPYLLSGTYDEAMVSLVDGLATSADLSTCRIAIDITGLMRPHLMFLTKLLRRRGVRKFDAFYAEPQRYVSGENTRFASDDMMGVKEVIGFQGVNSSTSTKEILIVGPGFDEALLSEVLAHKEQALRVEIFGLPSLQADMYQQNVLKAYRTDNVRSDPSSTRRRFASANDPFSVATELSSICYLLRRRYDEPRFYLSSLSTKAQALGFALFYMTECEDGPVSVLHPFTAAHVSGTSVGVAAVWRYTLDFDLAEALRARQQLAMDVETA